MNLNKNNEQLVDKEKLTTNKESKVNKEQKVGKKPEPSKKIGKKAEPSKKAAKKKSIKGGKRCCKKKCKEIVAPSRKYCVKYHHKWEVINCNFNRFKNEDDQFGIKLCQMFFEDDQNNPLQPKGKIPVRPACAAETALSKFSSQFWEKYGEVLLAIAGAITVKKKGCRRIDLEKRAEAVAQLLIKGNFKTLRLMDGHGRILFLILKHLIDQKREDLVDSLKIELVDIDADVHAYHKGVFVGEGCKNIKVIHKDVLDMGISPATLVYLNFCGIAKSVKKVETFREEYKKQQISFVLSFSISRNAAKSIPIINLKNVMESTEFASKLDTGRKGFVT
ncbi:histon H1 [Reticulomyxa filosa]|uniref:Histon H1 n=1 Tax=Reticulomyxa filosa TaxID=46433 RepID=X6LKM9_RETFI|nr:histon H1 [Reticulomyxa filosa]|eukprot:ETO01891.1 histon H1 [Reticulomyxa filosa]